MTDRPEDPAAGMPAPMQPSEMRLAIQAKHWPTARDVHRYAQAKAVRRPDRLADALRAMQAQACAVLEHLVVQLALLEVSALDRDQLAKVAEHATATYAKAQQARTDLAAVAADWGEADLAPSVIETLSGPRPDPVLQAMNAVDVATLGLSVAFATVQEAVNAFPTLRNDERLRALFFGASFLRQKFEGSPWPYAVTPHARLTYGLGEDEEGDTVVYLYAKALPTGTVNPSARVHRQDANGQRLAGGKRAGGRKLNGHDHGVKPQPPKKG